MPYVTEASCDACPNRCRVEIFTPSARKWRDNEFKCIAGATTPTWVGADATPSPEPVLTRSLEDFSVTGPLSRRLLACVGCPMPCLLETEGLARRCVAGESHECKDRFGWNPVK